MLGLTLYRGRWHLTRNNKRCDASWKTVAEGQAFIWKIIDAGEDY